MNDAKLNLLHEQPYYALLLNKCRLTYTDAIPTAGVGVRNAQLHLWVNRAFFSGLSKEHRVGLLIHEMMHLTNKHLERGKRYEHHKLANIAQDIAINQYIDPKLLPTGGLLPSQFPGFPEKQAFDVYYGLLMQQKEKIEQMIKDMGLDTLDDHSGTGGQESIEEGEEQANKEAVGGESISELDAKIIEQAIKAAARETKEKFSNKWGNVPKEIRTEIDKLFAPAVVNWKAVLKQFIGQNLSRNQESTRTRANRRLGLSATGYKKEYTPRILIAIDQSGSVSDSLIAAFFTEINGILKNLSDKTTVVFFDTQIAQEIKLDKYDAGKLKRYATGGTDFTCVFDYEQKQKNDLVIIMSDGEAPAPENQPKNTPVLWCLPTGAHDWHLVGRKVHVNTSNSV